MGCNIYENNTFFGTEIFQDFKKMFPFVCYGSNLMPQIIFKWQFVLTKLQNLQYFELLIGQNRVEQLT